MTSEGKCSICGVTMKYDHTEQEGICPNAVNHDHPGRYVRGLDEQSSPGKIVSIATPAATGTYPGDKNQDGVYQLIINQIPPVGIWVECCAGSAAITKRIRPAKEMYVIEKDQAQAQKLVKELGTHAMVSCGDFIELLPLNSMLEEDYFLFIDPPYLFESRTSKQKLYNHEWTGKDHAIFLSWVVNCPAKVMICHPIHGLYSKMLEGWRQVGYEYMSHAGKRSDCLWMNYPAPSELHDYSYLGDNRTERQQIQRLASRLNDRFLRHDRLIQGKILSTMQHSFNSTRNQKDDESTDNL